MTTASRLGRRIEAMRTHGLSKSTIFLGSLMRLILIPHWIQFATTVLLSCRGEARSLWSGVHMIYFSIAQVQ